jgi:two-component system, OmpR family, response regulator
VCRPDRPSGDRNVFDVAAPAGNGTEDGSREPRDARRVLVAVDDPVLAELIPACLRFAGYETQLARTGADALAERSRQPPHLMVLDTQLRDPDGRTLAQHLPRHEDHPVLFLVPRNAPHPATPALTVGGNDYLTKPFSLDELTARIRAVLRRAGGADIPAVLRFADLVLDEDTQLVHRARVPVPLSPRERQILRHLLVNAGRIVTRAHIHEHVWPYDRTGASRAIDVHICTLRRKLDQHGPPLIRTLHGIGYTLETPDAAPPPVPAHEP